MFHILWMIIVGFIVGLIARALVPGNDQMGFLATVLVGIVGSIIGGLIGYLISRPERGSKFHPAGFIMSIVGSIVLILILHRVR